MSFIPLPSGENSALSAAGEGAASGLHFVQALREAAAQQARLNQTQQAEDARQAFEDELKLRAQGYIPYGGPPAGNPSILQGGGGQGADPAVGTMTPSGTVPDNPDVVKDLRGKQWIKDPNAEAGKTIGLSDDLAQKYAALGYDVKGGARVTPQVATSLRGALEAETKRTDADNAAKGKRSDAQTAAKNKLIEAGAEDVTPSNYTPFNQATSNAPGAPPIAPGVVTPDEGKSYYKPKPAGTQTVDTEHFNTPVTINHQSGQVTPLQLPPGVTHNDRPAAEPRKETREDWIRIATDPASAPDERKRALSAIALDKQTRQRTDAETAAADRAAQREADAKQKIADTFQAKHDKLQEQEQAAWELKQRYMDAATAAPSKQQGTATAVVDPGNGKTVTLDDAHRAYFRSMAQATQKKAMQLQDQARGIRQRMGWGEFGAQGGAAQSQSQSSGAAASSPAQPQASAQEPAAGRGASAPSQQANPQASGGRGQLTDQNIALDYLKRAGGDKAKARSLAAADGWKF